MKSTFAHRRLVAGQEGKGSMLNSAAMATALLLGVALAAGLAAVTAPASAENAPNTLVAVPYVGCASDGQQGPRPAPEQSHETPKLEQPIAQLLAFYAGESLGVLAPRGWYCFEADGSGGSQLIVTPSRHGSDLMDWHTKITTDAVELSLTYAGTSGRFGVAAIAARFFPVLRAFVQSVHREILQYGLQAIHPAQVTAADHILSKATRHLIFLTDAESPGLGTSEWLGPSSRPITGTFYVRRGQEPDLISLRVRLSTAQQQLTSTILHKVRADPNIEESLDD